MKAKDLLQLIPQEDLEVFASQTKVDYQVKKLNGVTMFQLLLFSLLQHDKASLRIMENLYSSLQFRMFASVENETTRYNSIRDRVSTINSEFFERIFYSVFEKFNHLFQEQDSLIRYDSTMIAVSSKLVDWGMRVGNKNPKKVQFKYTVATKGSFPCHVKIFTTQEGLSEDIALPITILENDISKTGIVVFDRGIASRKAFEKFTDQNRIFVTRVNTYINYQIEEELKVEEGMESETVLITEVLKVRLKGKDNKWGKKVYRLIKTIKKSDGSAIYFLSNDFDLSPVEISQIYKQRWDIEVFFKFLKQHLNLKHLITRNENGIKVMVYMTLILSILLIAFKKLNNVDSYKIAKLKFSQELETEIVKQIVFLSGGDPDKLPHLFNDS
jgi:hypothetical protein